MGRKILVAVDDSQSSEIALRQSIKLAQVLEKGLRVLHVIDKHRFVHGEEEAREELTEKAQKVVEKAESICREELKDFNVDTEEGYPHELIAEKATEDRDIDLVVLGSGGKDFYDRRLMGSVTEHIVQHSGLGLPCPVLVIPCGEDSRVLF